MPDIEPILPGFHPDPSICRAGADFYIVTSTFEYFPGLPVHRSRDLVHWELIGHVLDRPSQLDLTGLASSKGLYAPTIRWHDGLFFVVCTLVGHDPAGAHPGGNFVVTATDPAGPWSEPVWLGEPDSFDPSLFFDGDEAWFCATRPSADQHPAGRTEIWVQRFDAARLELIGEPTVIWQGALIDATWAEAPHLYRTPDGHVLLLNAEGGTAHDHAVTCARAEQVRGPYRNNPRNPVLTHRHLGERYPVVGAGHADLVEAADGSWWAVLLAMRTWWAGDGYHYPMGRETFLAEVVWEEGWPVINPGTGALRPGQGGLGGVEVDDPALPVRDDFGGPALDPAWALIRTPTTRFAVLGERRGWLALRPQPTGITESGSPAFVGRPQAGWNFRAGAQLDFAPRGPQDVAGLVLRQNEDHLLALLVSGSDGLRTVRAVRREAGVDQVAATAPLSEGPVTLAVEGFGLSYSFLVNDEVLATLDGRALSTTVAGGFTGTLVGLYTHAGGDVGGDAPVAWWASWEQSSSS